MLGVLFIPLFLLSANPNSISCDADSDCYYLPSQAIVAKKKAPALILLHCNGATREDLDTCRLIGDSLGWILATCHSSRNHRDIHLNDGDIVKTINKLLRYYPVDTSRIYLFGFSGQGVQALATMFLHPELVRGVITVCAHQAALNLAMPELLDNHFVYLVTRNQDWNLMANYQLYWELKSWGVTCTLAVTAGEHSAGSWREILYGCYWLSQQKPSK
ncbi:MAG: hypothetical protein ABIK23_00720 [candidate division WOR-3 bacterium]